MKLIELQKIISAAYDTEGTFLSYVNQSTGLPDRAEDEGDGLAIFVAREVADTFDEEATDEEQLEAAEEAVDSAAAQLNGVSSALAHHRMKIERRSAA